MKPKLLALIGALLFGASAPLAKLLLDDIEPIPLAALLYLGCGLCILLVKLFRGKKTQEAKVNLSDIKWLLGVILTGGVLAPIALLFSLKNTPAATGALLLNFEVVTTAILAMLFFKEAIGKRIWIAILVITLASILLSFDPEAKWGFSVSALGIILACLLWGMDNNFTRKLSIKDPFTIVIVKGLGAGSFSLILALILQQSFPDLKTILLSLALGAVSYGLSLLFIVMAMRDLGSTRSTALFGTAPFLGALISFLMTGDLPGSLFLASMGLMIVGSYLVLKEAHEHEHTHEVLTHDHKHRHDDGHHNHTHEGKEASLEHSHAHTHEVLTHTHPHTPDIHHRHGH